MAPSHSRHAYEQLPAETGPPCAPWQRRVEDFHIIYFDIKGTTPAARKKRARRYKDGIRRRLHRAKLIGPLLYYNKAVTPAPNPQNPKQRKLADPLKPDSGYDMPNSGHSYHTIELTHHVGGSGKRVQLLICDYNQYLVAFRRESDGVWSSWYRMSDWPLPDHFQAQVLKFDGSHQHYSTMGGNDCWEEMFYGLANYPEHMDADRLQKAFLRAVVLFCEAIRLRLVFNEMVRRLQLLMDAVDLTDYMWEQIKSWGHLCSLALECGSKRRGFVNRTTLATFIEEKKMTSFHLLLVDENSELMLLMRDDRYLMSKANKLTKKEAMGVVDAQFPAPAPGMA